MNNTNSALWAKAVAMARDGVDKIVAFRKIRADGGRDLTKDEDEFYRVYERFQAQPLFAKNMVRTFQRAEFQADVINAMLALDPATDDIGDDLMDTIKEFENGNFAALLKCFEALPTEVAKSLEERARYLWSRVYAQMESQQNAAAARANPAAHEQFPLPDIGEQSSSVPDVSQEV
jgi:hypothetical protein